MSTTRRPPRAHTPEPAAIDGGSWEIQTSPVPRLAGVELSRATGGTMIVPTGGSPRERCVRLHEMAHARITPRGDRDDGGLPDAVVQHCEDRRVHAHLTGWGFDLSPMSGLLDDHELTPDAIEALPRCVRASLVAATIGTGEEGRTWQAVHDIDPQAADIGAEAADRLNAHSTWQGTLDAGRYIVDLLGAPGNERAKHEAGAMRDSGVTEEEIDRAVEEIGGGTDTGSSGREHVTMDYTRPPLTIAVPQTMRAPVARLRTLSTGRLRHPARLHRDNRVFSYRRSTPGAGALLLDCSGSMSFTTDEIEGIVRMFPAGIVASYSGSTGGRGYIGELRIVAHHGRRVADRLLTTRYEWVDRHGNAHGGYGSNYVDAHALAWLLKQPGPRYWASDLGVGDRREVLACLALVRIGKVTVIDRAGDLLDLEQAAAR